MLAELAHDRAEQLLSPSGGEAPVYVVPRGVAASHILRLMAARGTRAVVVVSGMRPIGIVTARDLAERVPGSALLKSSAKVEEAMSSPVMKIGLRGTVAEALAMMHQRGIGHLPIVSERGSLVSLLTLEDALRLRELGDTGLEAFARASVVIPISRRHPWQRMVYAVRTGIRENRLWWFVTLGLALAGTALALAIGRSWLGFQTYQPKDYEPKDIPRQQYEEQKKRVKPPGSHPGAR